MMTIFCSNTPLSMAIESMKYSWFFWVIASGEDMTECHCTEPPTNACSSSLLLFIPILPTGDTESNGIPESDHMFDPSLETLAHIALCKLELLPILLNLTLVHFQCCHWSLTTSTQHQEETPRFKHIQDYIKTLRLIIACVCLLSIKTIISLRWQLSLN